MTFENMVSTMMYCEGSQEADFAKMLADVSRYRFTSKGELILQMRFGAGEMTFR
jgi:heat shock protein HslJ